MTLRWIADGRSYSWVVRGDEVLNGGVLNEYLIFPARIDHPLGLKFEELARLYGVPSTTVRKAMLGLTWAWVPMPAEDEREEEEVLLSAE